jgi:hypothetical protein
MWKKSGQSLSMPDAKNQLLLVDTLRSEFFAASWCFALLRAAAAAEGLICKSFFVDPDSEDSIGSPDAIDKLLAATPVSEFETIVLPLALSPDSAFLQLARKIKDKHPDKRLLGMELSFDEDLARSFLEDFDFLDGIMIGNPLTSLPAFIKYLQNDESDPGPAVISRKGSRKEAGPSRANTSKPLDLLPDYSAFFEQQAATKNKSGPPAIPFPVSYYPLGDAVDKMLALAKLYKTLRFHLGEIRFDSDRQKKTLSDLAGLREEHWYGFSFECVLGSWPSSEDAELLERAGVRLVKLDLSRFEPSVITEMDIGDINLLQIETVRYLFAAGIDVSWRLLDSGLGLREKVDGLSALYHLPSPDGVIALAPPEESEMGDLIAAIEKWRQSDCRGLLTFAQGPGFIRVFDRRLKPDWTFINLTSLQTEIFLMCEKTRSFEEIAEAAPETRADKLLAFLNTLIERRVLWGHNNKYLNLSIRRKIEERWASADY